MNLINEKLYEIYAVGTSSKGIIHQTKIFNKSLFGKISPNLPLVLWCIRNLEQKIWLENFFSLLRIIWKGEFLIIIDIIIIIKNKFIK
jgi:hypothetical protein